MGEVGMEGLGHVVAVFPASLQDAVLDGDLDPGLKSGTVNLDAFSIGDDSNMVNGDRNAGLYSDLVSEMPGDEAAGSWARHG